MPFCRLTDYLSSKCRRHDRGLSRDARHVGAQNTSTGAYPIQPRLRMRIVKINHGGAAFRHGIKQTTLLFGHTGQRPYAGQMGTLGIGDDGNRRLRQLRQRSNFARVTHAEFDDGIAMLRAKAQ